MEVLQPTRSTVLGGRHHGLPLVPSPSQDPRDPLRWPYWLKICAIFSTAFFNFQTNFYGTGLSVAAPALQHEFGKSPSEVNHFFGISILLLGLGNFFWVPMAEKFGKRPAMCAACLMTAVQLVWQAKEKSWTGLYVSRLLGAFAAAAGESIVPSIVSDIFFLHERATMMAVFTIMISISVAIGPLIASFVVQYSPGGWRDFVWLSAALAAANLIAIFFLYPESNFERPEETEVDVDLAGITEEKSEETTTLERTTTHVEVVRKPWKSIWLSTVKTNRNITLLESFFGPWRMALKPAVIFAFCLCGTALAAQLILTYNFSNFLIPPPYSFSLVDVGLMQIAAIIGFLLGTVFGGYVADLVNAAVIRRAKGLVYSEQRLMALAPACWVGPVGCIIIAFAGQEKLHWIALAFGYGMVSFGCLYAPNISITYVVECYPKRAAAAVVAVSAIRNMVSFAFVWFVVDWVDSQGFLQVYMIMFMLTTLSTLLAVVFYFFGAKWRGARV